MKAPSNPEIVVDESVSRRLKLASLITANLGVLSQDDVDHLVTNEGRLEIPHRILKGFSTKEEVPGTASLRVRYHSCPRVEVLSEIPKPCAERSSANQLSSQRQFYKKLGWIFSDSGLVIPRRKNGFDRLLVMANPVITNNGMYEIIEASFPCWRYVNDLSGEIPERNDERHPCRGPYAIWVRDCIEADEVHKNKSATTILGEDIKTLTLLERMYLEVLVYHETGKHLDQESLTLCSGSRNSGGFVTYVNWENGFHVRGFDIDDKDDDLRARQVIAVI